MRMPTVASAIVEVAVTRRPASSTGPESGRSTVQNRRHGPKPTAIAALRVAGSTESSPSVTDRVMIATP